MNEPLFRRSTLAVLSIVAIGSFLVFLVLLVFGDAFRAPPSHGTDGYSVSALGHRAFARLLAESGIPVVTSRHASASRSHGALLVVAEPDLSDDYDGSAVRLFRSLLDRPGPTLLVLPRRRGFADDTREGFVDDVAELSISDVERVLAPIDRTLRVVRVVADGEPADTHGLGPPPSLPDPVQLLRPSAHLDPLVRIGDGVLLGRILPAEETESEVWVLSDPDLIATHGLVRPGNALLAVGIVAAKRPADTGAVVFDETLHGYDLRPSLWEALFRPPLVWASASALLAGIVLVGAGAGRFGRPKPLPPAIAPGKRFLVTHAAALQREGGRPDLVLERYRAAAVADAGRALHAPAHLDAKGLRAWLAGSGRGRRLAEVEDRVRAARKDGDEHSVIEAAKAVHTWREATKHGHRDDS
jgi:hypothetical protein